MREAEPYGFAVAYGGKPSCSAVSPHRIFARELRTRYSTRTKTCVRIYTMLLTYQYRIQPDVKQQAQMDWWCELLRRHQNYALGQRLDWLRRTRCLVDRCSLISTPIGEIPGLFPNYYLQAGELKQTKALFPEYKNIYHDVQQQNLKRLEKAWERWIKQGGSAVGLLPPPTLRLITLVDEEVDHGSKRKVGYAHLLFHG